MKFPRLKVHIVGVCVNVPNVIRGGEGRLNLVRTFLGELISPVQTSTTLFALTKFIPYGIRVSPQKVTLVIPLMPLRKGRF